MEKKDLSATSWMATRLTVAVLVAGGIGFAALGSADPNAPFLGMPVHRLLSWGLASTLFLIASLSWEKNQLRVRNAELMEALNQLLYGKDYSQQREAIEILLNALESKDATTRRTAHENLVRITGQNFAEDVRVWRAWWDANRATWARRRQDG
jgi:hypothetical protein